MSEKLEPFFIREIAGIDDPDARRMWIAGQADVAIDLGGVMFRATIHDTEADRTLFEAWAEYPADQGEPRWDHTTHRHNANEGGGE